MVRLYRDQLSVPKGQGGAVGALLFPIPPRPGFLPGLGVREPVVVDGGAQIPGRRLWEGVLLEQSQNGRGAFEEAQAEGEEPGLRSRIPERGEPHLPVEPRLVGSDESRTVV